MHDKLITPPTEEPVSATGLRSHLRDVADAESELNEFIKAARELVEKETGLALITQTRRLTLDEWPLTRAGDGLGWWDGVREGALIGEAMRYVVLPKAPLQSVSSIKTYSGANEATTFDPENYYADTGKEPGRVSLQLGGVWPIPTRPTAGIEIDYVCGYEDADAVPSALKMAILQIAAHFYENRELIDLESGSKVPMQAERIIQSHRIMKL